LPGEIPLPEVDGRIDHFAIDVKGRRAFLAALAKNTIEVVDLRAGRVARTLPGFAKPQGVIFDKRTNAVGVPYLSQFAQHAPLFPGRHDRAHAVGEKRGLAPA
jgi:hypothetical protein